MLHSGKITKSVPLVLLLAATIMLAACKPFITSLDPVSGAVGSGVTISGGNFASAAADNKVYFGTVMVPSADVTVVSSSKLTVKVPEGAASGKVTISTPDGTTKAGADFTVLAPPTAGWTFMVYLDADNNLEPDGINDFLEMAETGSQDGINIVVQMDRRAGYSSAYGDWKDTRRFLINKGTTPASTPLKDMGELNMGDPAVLTDFVSWAMNAYPAEHYALSIWNHGDGWRKSMMKIDTILASKPKGPGESNVKAVASDDTDNDILFMREVQDALTSARAITGRKLDLIGFDACLMGMTEVAYALRNETSFMTASEELEPGAGWPYNTIMDRLADNPSMTPAALASLIVTSYVDSYSDEVTMAAYDMNQLSALCKSVDDFTAAATGNWNLLKAARLASRQYHPAFDAGAWGTDLIDFTAKVNAQQLPQSIKNAASNLASAASSFVIKEAHTSDMNGSNGLAIYFPPRAQDFNGDPQHTGYLQTNSYMKVDFVSDHLWDEWLLKYYAAVP